MSQVELHAVNHTAFPRYERAAKRALEVVLSPGDALYLLRAISMSTCPHSF